MTVLIASLCLRVYGGEAIETLNLAPVASMAFADEQPGDGKGGWFDQGPQSDLSGFPSGSFTFSNIPFSIVDSSANGGKSALILAGSDKAFLPQTATVPVTNSSAHGYLYLIHAAGWLPPFGDKLGHITIAYADGTKSVLNIISGKEVSNWFNASNLENGFVAWTKPTRAGRYGVYVSEFKTLDKPIASVTFSSERNAVWAVIGATLSASRFPLPRSVQTVTSKGKLWRPFTEHLDVIPGSALDFSNLLDTPAGKYGPVTVRNGHFYFKDAPGKRIRFYGTNLCYSANFPTHAEAERLAQELAATGYNVVRFHHYDDMLTMDSRDSMTPDPDKLDRMEYLMAQCEKRGMYLVIDLYSFRQIREGEIPEIKGAVRSGFKALPPVLNSAMNNWKTFARNVLTHKNPYTGMTLAADPALVGICPVNEDPLGSVWHDSPAITEFYDNLFAKWKLEHSIKPNGWNEEQAATSRFLNEIQLKGDRMYEAFLRNELHVKAPLTGTNCLVAISLTEPRSRYDYVDNHIYWDHPEFPTEPWKLPYLYHQLSAIEASAFVPRTMFPTRIKGRPFTVTEWNYCNPNRFRAEGAALMNAYAGLQDWDGLYRFAHSHNIENLKTESAGNGFDLSTDPISQLTERVGALMFLRGDVAPAKGFVTVPVDATNAYRVISAWSQEGFEEPLELVGLCTGVGSVWAENMPPSSLTGPISGSTRFAAQPGYVAPDRAMFAKLENNGVIPAGSVDLANGIFKSDTGEITLNSADGTFVVSTARGEWFVANGKTTLKGVNASVTMDDGPTTVAVVSLDGKTIPKSGHLLVIHVTEQANCDARFANKDMRLLEDWGKLPHVMRAGRATLEISTTRSLKAYSLNLSGKRLKKAKLGHCKGGATIVLSNEKGKEAILAYEIIAK